MKSRTSIAILAAALSITNLQAFSQTDPHERAMWGSVCGKSNATSKHYQKSIDKVLVSWRMLPGDTRDTAFDLYRTSGDETEVKINDTPIAATNFQDSGLSLSEPGDVCYRLTYAGQDESQTPDIQPYHTMSSW